MFGSDVTWFAWIDCPLPVPAVGLAQLLETRARVFIGEEAPEESPSFVILYRSGIDGLSEGIKRVSKPNPNAPVIVFAMQFEPSLAWAALKAGARGFVHAGMKPEQIIRAITVVMNGELATPRQLLEHMLAGDESETALGILSARQREVLALVVEGTSNAQIASRLSISESTVKQHLRAAYKLLGVRNRTEAARLARVD
jgi:DNA-binding NarL/FixJ family response regulator